MDLTCKTVTQATWPDLESLFEGKGGPSYCWCMAFRRIAPGAGKAERKDALRERVAAGVPVGLVYYDDAAPVAWSSIAPRETYQKLGGPDEPGEVIWSLACMYIRRDLRGQGLTRQMVALAEAEAAGRGATVIEATPVDSDSPSYKFMGTVPFFAAAGYAEVARVGTRRHVMRKRLV
jgi:GNAT superfamily N-acetyltransferase